MSVTPEETAETLSGVGADGLAGAGVGVGVDVTVPAGAVVTLVVVVCAEEGA